MYVIFFFLVNLAHCSCSLYIIGFRQKKQTTVEGRTPLVRCLFFLPVTHSPNPPLVRLRQMKLRPQEFFQYHLHAY